MMRICLIRGLAREQKHWEKFPDFLRNRIPGVQLEFLDLPGNGEFSDVQSPNRPMAFVDFLRQHAQFVREGTKAHLITMSFASMVSHLWATEYPQDIASLVLINSSMRPTLFFQRMRPSGFLKLAKAVRTQDLYEREKQILELTTNHMAPKLEEVCQSWAAQARVRRTSRRSAINQILSAAQIKISPKIPTIPYLVLSSKSDNLVNSKSSEEMARFWHCSHKMHWSAGHDIPIDDPDWVSRQLVEFYNEASFLQKGDYTLSSP